MSSLLRLESVPLSRWVDFHSGRLEAEEIARDPIASRWSRVARTGLPAGGPAHPEGVDQRELDDRCAKIDALLGGAGEGELTRFLLPELDTRRLVAVLADAEGVILRARATSYADRAAEARLVPGAAWHELARGTNAIGTAIEERKSVAIIGRAHYELANHALFCYATPIIDPYGEVAGAFDVTGDVAEDDPAIAAAVRYVGASLEGSLRASAYSAAVTGGVRFIERMLDRSSGPALLLEAPGTVRHLNDHASRTFGIDPAGRTSIERLFGIAWDDLVRETRAQGAPPIFEMQGEARGARYALTLDPIVGSGGRVLSVVVHADAIHTRTPRARPSVPSVAPAFSALAGDDAALVKAKEMATRLAPTEVPILLLAETGTGKDMMARAIHQTSPRARRPLVALNCGAFSPQLLESELFGFAPGSFTGARAGGHEGKLASASGGTLFLDEIGEMSPALQAMLLRVLEDGTYSRIGESSLRRANFRLICATCRDIPAMVSEGTFRSDLFYRIHGACITLPPLRARKDRAALAKALLEQAERETGRAAPALGQSALAYIARHDWPGNVRELKNALRHALVLSEAGTLEAEHFPALVLNPPRAPAVRSVREVEADAVSAAVRAARGNLSEAARTLGVSRSTLYRMMRRAP